MARKKKETPDDRKERFLVALEKYHGNISRASKAIGINRKTYHEWYKTSPEFKESADEIYETVKDELEYRLVLAGLGKKDPDDPKDDGGKKFDKDSFTCAMAFMNARAKDRGYSRERVEHTGAGGGPIEHRLTEMTDEELRAIAKGSPGGAGKAVSG